MQTRMCTSAIWIVVLLAALLLTFRGEIGLLAVVLLISLFFGLCHGVAG